MRKRQRGTRLMLFSELSIAHWRQKSRNSGATPWKKWFPSLDGSKGSSRSDPPLGWNKSSNLCKAKSKFSLKIWPKHMSRYHPRRQPLPLPLRSLPHPATRQQLPSRHQPLRPQPVCLLPLLQPHRYHPWLQPNHPCTPLAALHTLIMAMRDPTFALRDGSQIGDLLDVSSVMRKVTLHTAAPPVHYCSAYCANRHGKPLKDHQGDKSLNSLPRKVAKATPRVIQTSRGVT